MAGASWNCWRCRARRGARAARGAAPLPAEDAVRAVRDSGYPARETLEDFRVIVAEPILSAPFRPRTSGTLPGGVPARVNAAVTDNTHVRRGLSGRSPERLARRCRPLGRRSFPGRHDLWCPYHRMLPLPQTRGRCGPRQRALLRRGPGNQAKPAADITDWTALTLDDFFAAPRAACRAESVPAAAVPETERRLAAVCCRPGTAPIGSSGSPLGCTLGVGSAPSRR